MNRDISRLLTEFSYKSIPLRSLLGKVKVQKETVVAKKPARAEATAEVKVIANIQ